MAKKRMFCMEIVDSDAFMEMPGSSQLLYFHLGMRADNEGFVANPKGIIKRLGSGDDDYKVLLAKKFILEFASGVCVIKHWLMHNAIRLDREGRTVYALERSQLFVKQNKSYTLDEDQQDIEKTHYFGNARQLPGKSQANLTKLNLTKHKEKKEKRERSSPLKKKEDKKKYGEFENVLLTDIELSKLHQKFGESNTNVIIEELSSYIASRGRRYSSHYATLLGWARRKVERHLEIHAEKKANQRTIV